MPEPGTPLPFGPRIPEVLIQEMGDYSNGDGVQMLLHGDLLVVQAKMNGLEMYLGVDVTDVLDAIQKLNRQVGS